jgi:hypothetical protein
MSAQAENKNSTTVMLDPETRMAHLVPTEDFQGESEHGWFRGITILGPALCGRITEGLTVLHPVGDQLRYQDIIGQVEACVECQAVVG